MNAQGRLRPRDQIQIYTKSKVLQWAQSDFTRTAFKKKEKGGEGRNAFRRKTARILYLFNKAHDNTGMLCTFTQCAATLVTAATTVLLCNLNLCNTLSAYTVCSI